MAKPEQEIDEQYVVAGPEHSAALDEALGIQTISIRLDNSLLTELKALAQLKGLGLQPLIRHILTNWAEEAQRTDGEKRVDY